MRVLEPKRARYRKRTGTYKSCQFCSKKIIKDQGVKNLDTEYWHVLACKYPYLDGNLIIISKRHVENTDDLTKDEWADFPIALKNSQKALTKIFKAKSFNLGLNIGPNSGMSIKHIHWMLLPRPKKLNPGTTNTLHDIQVISMDYKTLVKKLKNVLK
jgi:diadenosine tetraphosphate (Ap4A) HIT family hydrolase